MDTKIIAQKVDPGEENVPMAHAWTQTCDLSIIIKSGALTSELSPLPCILDMAKDSISMHLLYL